MASDAATPDTTAPAFRRASEIHSTAVDWIWVGRLARGKLAILAGDPGLGKTAIAADVAARCSCGGALPGDEGATSEPTTVILVSAEDGAADTLRPRLEAAGADLDRVHLFVREAPMSIPGDLALLEEQIARTGATVVILDPLSALLAVVNAWRVGDVRRAIAPLAAMADRTRVAILAIEHLNKDATKSALYRTQGSIGFVAAARVALVVGRDPGDPDRRVLAVAKCNLARHASSLAYRVVDRNGIAGIEWLGVSPLGADQVLAQPEKPRRARGSARTDAEACIRAALAHGPVPARVIEQVAREHGISEPTLRRAKQALEVRSVRLRDEWLWSLPPANDGASDETSKRFREQSHAWFVTHPRGDA